MQVKQLFQKLKIEYKAFELDEIGMTVLVGHCLRGCRRLLRKVAGG